MLLLCRFCGEEGGYASVPYAAASPGARNEILHARATVREEACVLKDGCRSVNNARNFLLEIHDWPLFQRRARTLIFVKKREAKDLPHLIS
jgi:hypothetical protein